MILHALTESNSNETCCSSSCKESMMQAGSSSGTPLCHRPCTGRLERCWVIEETGRPCARCRLDQP